MVKPRALLAVLVISNDDRNRRRRGTATVTVLVSADARDSITINHKPLQKAEVRQPDRRSQPEVTPM